MRRLILDFIEAILDFPPSHIGLVLAGEKSGGVSVVGSLSELWSFHVAVTNPDPCPPPVLPLLKPQLFILLPGRNNFKALCLSKKFYLDFQQQDCYTGIPKIGEKYRNYAQNSINYVFMI